MPATVPLPPKESFDLDHLSNCPTGAKVNMHLNAVDPETSFAIKVDDTKYWKVPAQLFACDGFALNRTNMQLLLAVRVVTIDSDGIRVCHGQLPLLVSKEMVKDMVDAEDDGDGMDSGPSEQYQCSH
eukprot:6210909-Pleurochrysis_carterae.AAC.1